MKKIALLIACLVMLAGVGCSKEDTVDVSATFPDVGDLAVHAPVHMADIQVGKVTGIELAGTEALVEISLYPEAQVPEGVTARVRRTSVLGERIIDLVVPEDAGSSTPLLADGDEITDTYTRSDLEDLVAEGQDVLGAIAASDLAIMIDEGARGFGDKGDELRDLLNNYRRIVKVFANRSDEITGLISNMRTFNETLASQAGAHSLSLKNTARSFEVLEEESARLEDAIVSLNRLAVGGQDILHEHTDEMANFFRQMNTILGIVAEEQDEIAGFLKWAPGHNENTQRVEYIEFNQVYQDFVICGLNDNPKDRARRCTKKE
jgi:phospholipid/cholesterol/gamma-HCH transport system substrate-binding protein